MTTTWRTFKSEMADYVPSFKKLPSEAQDQFLDILTLHGVENYDIFEDTCWLITKQSNGDEYIELAQMFYLDVDEIVLPNELVIDWRATWDQHLSKIFSVIRYDSMVYFFFK